MSRNKDERKEAREGTRRDARKQPRRDARPDERGDSLAQPQEKRPSVLPRLSLDSENFGVASEKFARFMGTATFLIWMTLFVVIWLVWNTFMPESAQFDPRSLNYTLLTLILSLQASYAAPLILLAQNRQDDRDRVGLEQDRARDERNLADTEFLTREVASLRLAMRETATRDFVRSELRSLLEEMQERGFLADPEADGEDEDEARTESRREARTSGQRPGR